MGYKHFENDVKNIGEPLNKDIPDIRGDNPGANPSSTVRQKAEGEVVPHLGEAMSENVLSEPEIFRGFFSISFKVKRI